jgi:hypothetical protein
MNRRRRFKAKRARRHARLFRDAMIGVVVAARAAWRRDHPMTKLLAPWTDAQVNALNRWQSLWHAHPFTCPSEQHPGVSLVARHEGWFCPLCDYRQDWAHAEMASGAWPPPFPGNIAEFVKTEGPVSIPVTIQIPDSIVAFLKAEQPGGPALDGQTAEGYAHLFAMASLMTNLYMLQRPDLFLDLIQANHDTDLAQAIGQMFFLRHATGARQ